MSAEPSELRRSFVLVGERTTVGEVRDRIATLENLWIYVVVALAGERFSVFRLGELIEILKASSPTLRSEILLLSLGDVPNLLVSRMANALEEAGLTAGRVRALLKDAPRGRWVVLRDGQVTGVLAVETRSASLKVDLQWLNSPSASGPPIGAAPRGRVSRHASDRIKDRVTKSGRSTGRRARVLTAAEPEPEPAPAPEAETEKRWINAELERHEASEPVRVGGTYTIAFDVDVEVRTDSLLKAAAFTYSFPSGEEDVDLTVQLSSEDFEIFTEPQKLRVPRHGRSRNKARFDFSPKHEGPGVLQAVLLKDGNFVQLVTLRLDVGEPVRNAISSPRVLGRSLDASFAMQPRDVTLVLTNTGHGFQAILAGAVSAIATLPITLPQLDQMIAQAREELQGVVDLESGRNKSAVYQAGIDIPKEVNDAALRAVARAGFRLFQQIFSGPGADAQSRLLGARLREMAQKERLKIQILSEQFFLPWGILYMADSFDPDHIDPELFLGFKHVIEHIPLQPAMQVLASTIDGRPLLSVSLNINADIDEQMGLPVIAGQLEYWDEISRRGATKLIVRKTGDEVKRALADPSSPDQLLYFYCHAVSKSLSEGGGPDASALVLSGDARLTLGDLSVFAPIGDSLAGAPLVFINACESAEMSPLFYDGFVPYFMGKGARGVIGTECQTPAIFAAEWARRFFDEFLQGKALGQLFLDLRREFYERHNNLLGLLYALYCDGDTHLLPASAGSGGSHDQRPDA